MRTTPVTGELTMGKQISHMIKNMFLAIVIPLILYLLLLLVRPEAMSGSQILDILRQAMLPTILAWGVSFACKLGLWHFAAGANVIAGVIIGGGIANRLGGNIFLTAGSIIVISLIIGYLSGLLYIKIRVPSIIATVGTMLILESVAALAWGGGGVTVDPEYGEFFNRTSVVILVTLISFAIAYFLYSRTKYGFNLKAVSNNINVSEQQGIHINRVKLISFVLVGLYSGFYGVLTLARSNVQNPTTNMGSMDMVFSAIMCFFVAASLEKYVNLIVGVYIGGVTVQLIKYGIVSMGVSGQFNNAAVAIALLVFCAVSSESPYMMQFRNVFRRSPRKVG